MSPRPGGPEPGERGQDGPERARRAADALAAAKADARARGERAPARDFDTKRMAGGDPAARVRRAARGGRDRRVRRDRWGQRGPPCPEGGPAAAGRGHRAGCSTTRGGGPRPRWARCSAGGSRSWATTLAAHTRPGGFADGELLVIADSTAWATQVRLLRAQLVRRLNAELGNGTVTGVKVRGPVPAAAAGPMAGPRHTRAT